MTCCFATAVSSAWAWRCYGLGTWTLRCASSPSGMASQPEGIAGTAVDIATWRRHARAVTVVSPSPDGHTYSLAGPGNGQPAAESESLPQSDGSGVSPRVVRAMLFADVAGFSRLTDELLPVFARSFLSAFAAAVDRYRNDVWHRNTWGDALYVVLTNARIAASCALDLQEAVAAIDLEALGLPRIWHFASVGM